ncbi:MAG: DUF488 domain-containing protein [Acidimicrobiales bacterium]
MTRPRPRCIVVVRVYEDPGREPGDHRVLVDRLWPRGVARAVLDHDQWAKELTPSTELRRWYGHSPDRFEEFSRRYRDELDSHEARTAIGGLVDISPPGRLVLLTATRDVEHSGAVVLKSVLDETT